MTDDNRSISLLGATNVGVGAIVGGGILALAGVAFATAGPSAIIAFALNGVIALLTALSFSELSAAFPQSGGTYTFSKRVLNVHTAFIIGWIVWFASIVAGVLYALGFAIYAVIVFEQLWLLGSSSVPSWLVGAFMQKALAVIACLFYTFTLMRKREGGGDGATYGKVVVFGIIIAVGLWAVLRAPSTQVSSGLSPFMPNGWLGIVQAMGFSFIALQGFDLIAAVAGEVKSPSRNIPRAMIASLVVALVIYIPLLFVVTTVGLADGQSIVSLSQAQPETVIAIAAQQFMGSLGYWLVIVAAVLAMLSALQANVFAASFIAFAMAKDRTLPKSIAKLNQDAIPANGLWLSSFTLILLVIIIPDVAAAGAAASLIFLISFALVHVISILARLRSKGAALPFKLPAFPLIPILGGLACFALAVFQGIIVPSAGIITLLWLIIGLIIYASLFARNARVADAAAEARDPSLIQYRGRSPLVLLPIANPNNAAALVEVAHAISPERVGRVMLLSVVSAPSTADNLADPLSNAQNVLANSLKASFAIGLNPEALTTIATDPWQEMARVAKVHRCESMLLGFSELSNKVAQGHLGRLLNKIDCDVAVLRAPEHWSLVNAKRILVPVAGGSQHDVLRVRLLASLQRINERDIHFLRILPQDITDSSLKRAERALGRFASEEVWSDVSSSVLQSANAVQSIIEASEAYDLIILGSKRSGRSRSGLGDFARSIAQQCDCAVMIVSHRV